MTTSMYSYERLIAVTNRHLSKGDYFKQIEKIVSLSPKSIIIREKDLPKAEYKELARKVLEISKDTPCFIHSHTDIAKELGCSNIHFSIPKLKENKDNFFKEISVSCHSLEDVKLATELGATQIVLGNIFETQCKKGLAGKGLEFLKKVADSTTVPVYAIGGINQSNLKDVILAGAEGGCMMSGFMQL